MYVRMRFLTIALLVFEANNSHSLGLCVLHECSVIHIEI